ncbi:hypothetical protein PTTG_07902 [Puccinia triticina 1-1 BBBD Race 1]|uniref:Uncharacterized protein n=1 Tax=Puccinia triticina (isolate 1-1 / race 1 (BBBD)) TaxID=630390 RepID=A0A0C4F468_PUCT1|nr:hypothetical protein PTTG_07902 [Puccinia triticina 1-1 BBBD Race 1]
MYAIKERRAWCPPARLQIGWVERAGADWGEWAGYWWRSRSIKDLNHDIEEEDASNAAGEGGELDNEGIFTGAKGLPEDLELGRLQVAGEKGVNDLAVKTLDIMCGPLPLDRQPEQLYSHGGLVEVGAILDTGYGRSASRKVGRVVLLSWTFLQSTSALLGGSVGLLLEGDGLLKAEVEERWLPETT